MFSVLVELVLQFVTITQGSGKLQLFAIGVLVFMSQVNVCTFFYGLQLVNYECSNTGNTLRFLHENIYPSHS